MDQGAISVLDAYTDADADSLGEILYLTRLGVCPLPPRASLRVSKSLKALEDYNATS